MLPSAYIDRMTEFMGDKCLVWIKEAEESLSYAINRFELSNLKCLDLSYNIVYAAESGKYGDVVLKLCLPGKEYMTELNAIHELNKNHMVKCIAYDEEKRILLLEQLKPGQTLWHLPIKERLEVAVPIINQTPNFNYTKSYPKFIDWILRIRDYIGQNYPLVEMNDHLSFLIKKFEELNIPENPEMLIHGDLHHGNILKGEAWTVIDPKGAIGYKSLEVGRYMNNQIQEDGINEELCLKEMISCFSKGLELSERTILLSFYADMVLSTSWFYESYVVDEKAINEKIKIIRMIRNGL